MTGNEKNYTAVLLEDVNSNMKAFWEVLSGVKERGDATFEQVGLMTEKIDGIEIRLVLKTALSSKADKEKLEILEFKIVRIERHLKIAG